MARQKKEPKPEEPAPKKKYKIKKKRKGKRDVPCYRQDMTPPPGEEPAPRKKRGRPIGTGKFDPLVFESICNYIRMGSWPSIAAQANNVTPQTVNGWLRKGLEYKQAQDRGLTVKWWNKKYADFRDEYLKAEAEAELLDLQRLDNFADSIPAALMFKMARRYGARWREKQGIELTGKDAPVQTQRVADTMDLSKLDLSDEVLETVLDAIERKRENAESEAETGEESED